MKQIIQLDNQLMDTIIHLERECQTICEELEQEYRKVFEEYNHKLIIELTRIKNCKNAERKDLFEDGYESFIEIGIEQEGEYFPNSYIPIWKCKTEWFQKIGYLTKQNKVSLQSKAKLIINEILEDVKNDYSKET